MPQIKPNHNMHRRIIGRLSQFFILALLTFLFSNNINCLLDLHEDSSAANTDGFLTDEFQSVVAEQEATLYQWKNMAYDMANTLSMSSSCGRVPTPQTPFVFFHTRKAAGSNLRSIIDRKTKDLGLPQWIPCKNGVPCVPSSLPPPGEDGNEKAVYAGHVNYNHMAQLFRQRFAKTPTFYGTTDLRIMKTQNFRDPSTGRKHNHTYISLWHDNLHNSNFGSCLINIRPTVSRVVSCWNYRFIREVKEKLDVPVASNATVEEVMTMLPEAVDKFGNGCNNEIARILGRTNDENLINHLSVRTYGLKYFFDEMETVMSRMASCVVVRMDRCEDSNAILKHFLPWMHSEDLCKLKEKQSSFSGVVSDEVREAILAQNSFDELVFRFGEELFKAQFEVALEGQGRGNGRERGTTLSLENKAMRKESISLESSPRISISKSSPPSVHLLHNLSHPLNHKQ